MNRKASTNTISGFELNLSKMGSWNHMGHTGNMIIKDFIRQIYVPLENSVYFGDGEGLDSNPESACLCYRETYRHGQHHLLCKLSFNKYLKTLFFLLFFQNVYMYNWND